MMKRVLPFLTLIVLFIGLAIASPHFLTVTNLSSVVRQTAVINIIALGMTLIMISGGIDLSVGAILAFSGLLGTMMMEQGYGIPAAVLTGVIAGMFCGALNGVMIAGLKITPFIVTLGTLGIFRGVTLIISNGLPVHQIPKEFSYLGEGNLLGVPFVLWIVIACALLMHVLLENTRLGRYAFAIGSNPDAAFYTGIPIAFHTVAIYAIGGMLTGLSGMVEASRLMTGQPTAGQGYELQAIAAVVIGGGSLRGGEGSVVGTLVGAFIMGLLSNGSDLLGISPYLQQAIIGAVIIVAVTLDEFRKRGVVFNWGAFLITVPWLFGHRQYAMGGGLAALSAVVLAIDRAPRNGFLIAAEAILCLVYIGFAIWYGVHGDEIAQKVRGYSTVEERKRRQRIWLAAGVAWNAVLAIYKIVSMTR